MLKSKALIASGCSIRIRDILQHYGQPESHPDFRNSVKISSDSFVIELLNKITKDTDGVIIFDKQDLIGNIDSQQLLKAVTDFALYLLTVLDSAHNGIIAVDKNGTVAVFNRSAQKMSGLTEREALGKEIDDIIFTSKLTEVLKLGTPQLTQKQILGQQTVVTNRTPIKNNGEITGAVAVFQCISEVEAVSEELQSVKRLNQQLDMLINNSYDGIFVTDGTGTVLRVNHTVERILQTSEQELVGKNTRDLIAQGYYSSSSVLESISLRRTVTKLLFANDGTEIMATSTPVFDDNGKIVYVMTNSRDLGDLNELRRQLEQTKEESNRYLTELNYLRQQQFDYDCVIAESVEIQELLEYTRRIAQVESTVMLRGESGVGKEVIAKYIHRQSKRKQEAFIAVNCAAIPEGLLEAELFGYEAGAFTGAKTNGKPGMFELADKGVLFLDEIGELSPLLQAKLLRALESNSVTRLGSTKERKIDIRIIAATNQDLERGIANRTFRADLYYRLNVVPITIPPLRERPSDINALANFFLQKFCHKYKLRKSFSPATLRAFQEYNWPGNVRELRNLVERLIVTSPNELIEFIWIKTLPVTVANLTQIEEELFKVRPLAEVLQLAEAHAIRMALRESQGNKVKAAKLLAIHRSVLYRKIRNYGLTKS